MKTPRSSYYYKPARNNASEIELADKMNDIALEYPSIRLQEDYGSFKKRKNDHKP